MANLQPNYVSEPKIFSSIIGVLGVSTIVGETAGNTAISACYGNKNQTTIASTVLPTTNNGQRIHGFSIIYLDA
ncbi:MAG: hypothetical protein A3A29_00415 [Candidatus Ryanbacteria bacterium RIFCSPLOWO2_01_FULL_47_79]|uniref:Uncharacterized protein n=1 Tax=Candidatus Yanofskybacteria bacterium RIFCSPHIGHO2_12_FULL_45_19b TaxID=1802689 RepID=A0A1F8G232_9BACT|nr:MAG: hypothetical protein A3F25_02135 [Candidatus Yanofskybacteria bacterium RIFCSPHIGHO2_12_FULL_45_19b]OGZ53299.1 MAG: hypothetical protein A3A29_00415 [Candidatus Ryanbacteria bacterium RIFCSPLOWO2_01_FULL_47_79]